MGGPCYWLALVTAALMAAKASVPYISPCNSVRDNGWCSNCARKNTRRHGQRQAQHHIGATWRMPRTAQQRTYRGTVVIEVVQARRRHGQAHTSTWDAWPLPHVHHRPRYCLAGCQNDTQ